MPRRDVIIGTRGSSLARAQTERVIVKLREQFPGLRCESKVIITVGDKARDWSRLPADRGIFVKEIEDALLRGEIDMAVHSAKDLPTNLPPGLILASIPERLDPRDALVSKNGNALADLREGAVIGTGSVRRRAQLLRMRNDLVVKEIRGNLTTRIEKMRRGEADAIVVAAAGLIRMAMQHLVGEFMPTEQMLPAPCQAALAIEVRDEENHVREMVTEIDDAHAHSCILAERSFLRRVGGGCRVPVGALAGYREGIVSLEGMMVSLDGKEMVKLRAEGPAEDAASVGAALAEKLLRAGGEEILKGARAASGR
ncbi:MAG: hydroxymethylbilane synthase [Candidatus Aureabacteria bacterium]|nr:hydroxymethylbilane synthase [Candidatus Auribacterota bacterium]